MKSFSKLLISLCVFMTLVGIINYNSLISKSEEVDSQWGVVESKLQRRYDLIPNLVDSVKASMKQEQEVFSKIADARARMTQAKNQNEVINASNELEIGLGKLFAVMENYPELKSSENIKALMYELAGTENRISVERDRYNQKVESYNKEVKRFPSNIIARIMGFDAKVYFKSNEEAMKVPKVNF